MIVRECSCSALKRVAIAVNKIVMDVLVLEENRTVAKARVMNIVGNKAMHMEDSMVYEVVVAV
jgi:hypothetical protein